jgi:hypothetical protein
MLENQNYKISFHQFFQSKSDCSCKSSKLKSGVQIDKNNQNLKKIKVIKVVNKSANAANLLPMIKEYQKGVGKSKFCDKRFDKTSSEIMKTKSAIHSLEIPFSYTSLTTSHQKYPRTDHSKRSVHFSKGFSKSKDYSKREISITDYQGSLTKVSNINDYKSIFSNELISKITQTSFKEIYPKKSLSPKFVDLFKMTKNKIKAESNNFCNIFLHPTLLALASKN